MNKCEKKTLKKLLVLWNNVHVPQLSGLLLGQRRPFSFCATFDIWNIWNRLYLTNAFLCNNINFCASIAWMFVSQNTCGVAQDGVAGFPWNHRLYIMASMQQASLNFNQKKAWGNECCAGTCFFLRRGCWECFSVLEKHDALEEEQQRSLLTSAQDGSCWLLRLSPLKRQTTASK